MLLRAATGRKPAAGSAQVEFALIAVFIIFILISIFDMARGLWINHTVAEAVRDGTRYAIVRGARYSNPITGVRLPEATLGAVKNVVLRSAVGLVPAQLTLKFYSGAGEIKCDPDCSASETSTWPPDGSATSGSEIGIHAEYPYNSMVVMFFPGAKGVQFGKFILGSTARERIVF